jgi:hypothetical protein
MLVPIDVTSSAGVVDFFKESGNEEKDGLYGNIK